MHEIVMAEIKDIVSEGFLYMSGLGFVLSCFVVCLVGLLVSVFKALISVIGGR